MIPGQCTRVSPHLYGQAGAGGLFCDEGHSQRWSLQDGAHRQDTELDLDLCSGLWRTRFQMVSGTFGDGSRAFEHQLEPVSSGCSLILVAQDRSLRFVLIKNACVVRG